MGNCCRRESSAAVWDGDDWESIAEREKRHGSQDEDEDDDDDDDDFLINMQDRQRLVGGSRIDFSSSSSSNIYNSSSSSSSWGSSSTGGEVKIKITKKELEEIMARVDRQGLSLEQVLAGLINNTDSKFEKLDRTGSWKPALQTIPEAN
ncbi:hypothetical protein Tsubulata_025150 [Turnera subulata]|uniref:Uncharacterized protein n=1 Tax=Turnera subulata TaxID=218843 RepID=A0A9Q0J3Y9_9ROSI|nr:hypothetical protein Tsubulata_025150 [Turnera subulata]